jgi:tRNA (cmo5U34)-methyltransferase
MTHSVERHLAVSPDIYDAEIRRFVLGYEAMLDEVVETIVRLKSAEAPLSILDLGAGTGALSARIAARLTKAKLTLLDADAEMLARAKGRLGDSERFQYEHGSFSGALPRVDLAVASLSLHHVHDPAAKRDVYENVRKAIAPGGFLVSADATIPRDRGLADAAYARWAAHLVASGDTKEQAFGRFADWAKEDRYFSIEEELDMIRRAGFASAEIVWRLGPSTVLFAARD